MIDLDTSALTKLLVAEHETPELRAWLATQSGLGESAVTSALTRIELMRVVARYGEPGQSDRARFLLDGLDILPITEAVVALAETVGPPTLRSLDAIHLAAAVQLEQELTAFPHLRPPPTGPMPRSRRPDRIAWRRALSAGFAV